MITQLKGKLIEKYPTHLVIECHGVGYEVNISLYTFGQIKEGEDIKLYTHLQIREDAHILYGFMTEIERAVFRLLISVSGIGTSTARTMLSSLTPEEVQNAILGDDVNKIKTVKGIGLKTAQRVIIELKDKIKNLYGIGEIYPKSNNTNKEETLSALEVLGYNRRNSEKVIDNLIQSDPESSVETLIKLALNKL